jgi:hypothetical protein
VVFTFVARLAAVALRHPDALDGSGLAGSALDQVALGAVRGLKNLRNGRPIDPPALGEQFLAQRGGQSGYFSDFRNPLAINSFCKLTGAPGRFPKPREKLRQRRRIQSKERRIIRICGSDWAGSNDRSDGLGGSFSHCGDQLSAS